MIRSFPLVRRVVAWALFALVGCDVADNGSGSVEGVFFIAECRPSGNFERQPYSFNASRVDTMRFESTLEIRIQENAVSIEETDGLNIRIDDITSIPPGEPRPLRRKISRDRGDVNAALSLFQTCPDRPTLHATEGEIVFTTFNVAVDPDDTGTREKIAGALTATVTTADGAIAGTISAVFDFEPSAVGVSEPQ